MEVQVNVNEDRALAVIDIGPQRFTLSADLLSKFIDRLMKARAMLTPPISLDIPKELPMVTPAAWGLDLHSDGSAVLVFAHPGFGYLAYQLPPDDVRKLRSSAAAGKARSAKPKGH